MSDNTSTQDSHVHYIATFDGRTNMLTLKLTTLEPVVTIRAFLSRTQAIRFANEILEATGAAP